MNLEVANTNQARQMGLSYRDSLPKNAGMLFIFEEKEIQNFWNKDMKFPIDVYWISEDKIIGESFLPRDLGEEVHVKSLAPVDKVLEVNAGTFANSPVGETIIYEE